MCSTKALLGGDGDVIAEIYGRVPRRGKGAEVWGWWMAYGEPAQAAGAAAATGERSHENPRR